MIPILDKNKTSLREIRREDLVESVSSQEQCMQMPLRLTVCLDGLVSENSLTAPPFSCSSCYTSGKSASFFISPFFLLARR
jgi:hypothetical protein